MPLKDGCDYFRLFFFLKQKKCSRVTSNCHLGMRVGAFENSDNEETFYFYSMVIKNTEHFLETCKLGNFLFFVIHLGNLDD
eukprot:UN13588